MGFAQSQSDGNGLSKGEPRNLSTDCLLIGRDLAPKANHLLPFTLPSFAGAKYYPSARQIRTAFFYSHSVAFSGNSDGLQALACDCAHVFATMSGTPQGILPSINRGIFGKRKLVSSTALINPVFNPSSLKTVPSGTKRIIAIDRAFSKDLPAGSLVFCMLVVLSCLALAEEREVSWLFYQWRKPVYLSRGRVRPDSQAFQCKIHGVRVKHRLMCWKTNWSWDVETSSCKTRAPQL